MEMGFWIFLNDKTHDTILSWVSLQQKQSFEGQRFNANSDAAYKKEERERD